MRSRDNVFGKLTLPCEETLSPERFEMFRVFSEMAGEIFKRVSELTKVISSRERRLLTENIVRNLKTEVAASVKPLDITLALYKQLEKDEVVEGESLTTANQQLYKCLLNLRTAIDMARVAEDGEKPKKHEGSQ
jgi:hypothetical protein